MCPFHNIWHTSHLAVVFSTVVFLLQEGGEQVLEPTFDSREANPDDLQSTPSAEDPLASCTPQRRLAQGPDSGLPHWARRAPRTGWAHACVHRAEVRALHSTRMSPSPFSTAFQGDGVSTVPCGASQCSLHGSGCALQKCQGWSRSQAARLGWPSTF